jgi:hypothetical protein
MATQITPPLMLKAFCDLSAHRFVVSNDVFKLKEYNLDSKQCRRTSLAPRFGNPPTTMLLIPPPPGSAAEPLPPPPAEENFPEAPSPSVQPQTDGESEAKAADGEAGAAPVPAQVPDVDEPVEESAPEKPPAPPAPVPEYFVFSTGARVVGVSSFPLTGDPSQVRTTTRI